MSAPIPSEIMPAAARKLTELRAKTDRDLAVLLRRTLEHGFELGSQAEYAEAAAVYARAAQLLPLATGVPSPEFTRLRTRLQQLRAYLDEVAFSAGCLAS